MKDEKKDKSKFPFFLKKKKGKKDKKEETKEKNESYENSRLEAIIETVNQILEGKKPDFLDFDKDGNKKESMVKAIGDKKAKKSHR